MPPEDPSPPHPAAEGAPDLEPGAVADALAGAPLGQSRRVVAVTESTMDLAWAARDAGAPHGFLALADRQRAGRGSYGRRWTSPGGSDLYLSLLLRAGELGPLRPEALGVLPLAAGLAVADVARAGGVQALVKWPNDVVVERDGTLRKLAGTLVEARAPAGSRVPDLVVGIGLNVGRTAFPPFGAGHLPGTSLALEGGPTRRLQVLRSVLHALGARLALLQQRGSRAIAAAVEERLWARGERARLAVEGREPELCDLAGLASDGALRVRVGKTERIVRSGRLAPASQYQ